MSGNFRGNEAAHIAAPTLTSPPTITNPFDGTPRAMPAAPTGRADVAMIRELTGAAGVLPIR